MKAERVEKAFSETIGGVRPATTTAEAKVSTSGDVAVNDLASEIHAGKLTPEAAVEKLLDRVVVQQVGPDAAPAVRDRVRAALRDALDSDPLLAEKLGKLR